MKKNIAFLLSIICLILLTSSCFKKRDAKQYNNYFPLKVGNTWLYEESYYYPDSAQTPNSIRQVKIEIIKDTIIDNNQIAFVIEQTTGTNSGYQYLWYAVDNELRERHRNSKVYSVIYRTDMEKDKEWTHLPNVSNREFNTRKVIEAYSKYPVLTGSSVAYKVQNGNPDLNQPNQNGELAQDIYAPGIGIIETDYLINYYGPSRSHKVLTDYYIE